MNVSWLAATVTWIDALAPSAEIVSVSAPTFVPVSSTLACPATSVVTLVELSVLPAEDETATARAPSGWPDESRSASVYSVGEFAIALPGPFSASVVPVTVTLTDRVAPPLVPVTVIVRLRCSETDRVAVAAPVASVRAETTNSCAPESVVAKSTCWLASARFDESLANAVIVAVVLPSDPRVGVLVVISSTAVEVAPPVAPCPPAPPPPHPASVATSTAATAAKIPLRLDVVI